MKHWWDPQGLSEETQGSGTQVGTPYNVVLPTAAPDGWLEERALESIGAHQPLSSAELGYKDPVLEQGGSPEPLSLTV